MARLTRSERSAETRGRVLTAAGELFRRKGFHGASLEEISEAAGFSKGVIYSQFGSKDDLFLALFDEAIGMRGRRVLERLEDAPVGAELRDIWEQAREDRRSDVPWELLILEFRVHAARNPELNRRFAELHARRLKVLADLFEVLAARTDVRLPCASEDLARFASALDSGGVLEELVDGPGQAFDVSRDALRLLLEGRDR